MKPETQAKLRELIDQSTEAWKAYESKTANLSDAIEKGALYIFDLPIEVPVQWCSIFTHPKDDDLWFAVPGDELFLVGTKDVEVPDNAEYGPINLRCGHGIWIHADDFNAGQKCGLLDSIFVEHVRDRLSRMVDDDLPTVDYLIETDSDPDYIDWIDELSAAAAAFEDQLHSNDLQITEPLTMLKDHFTDIPDYLAAYEPEIALAADDAQITPEHESTVSKYVEIPLDGPGKMVAVCYPSFVILQLVEFPETGDLPQVILGLGEKELEWKKRRDWYRSEQVPWVNDKATFAIAGRKFEILK